MNWFSRVSLTGATREGRRRLHQLRTEPYRQHQALWQLFDCPEGESQPFLFRKVLDDAGDALRFLLVSRERPGEKEGWRVESKPYQPLLNVDRRYHFSTRLNPTRTEKTDDGRGKRQDYVISRLHQLDARKDERPAVRRRVVQEELPKWLDERAVRHGFVVEHCVVERYEYVTTHGKGRVMTFSMADFAGVLQVTDPGPFERVLLSGLGHAKAFGCGLLLLKRLS